MTGPMILNMDDLEGLADPAESSDGKPPVAPVPPVVPPTDAAPRPDPTAEALREALRISEQARLGMQQQMRPAEAPAAQQPKWYNDDELLEMIQSDDPAVRLQAMRVSSQQQVAQAAQYFQGQLNQINQSIHTSAEASARTRYAREFELYGPQIADLVSRTDPAQLTSNAVWDNLISYIRGLPGNIDKYVEYEIAQRAKPSVVARQEQHANAGFTATTPFPPSQPAVVVDQLTREIAENLGYAKVEDYIKDMKLTQAFNVDA